MVNLLIYLFSFSVYWPWKAREIVQQVEHFPLIWQTHV